MMKNIHTDITYVVLALLGAALLSYCNFSIAKNDPNSFVVGIGSMMCYSATLISLVGMKHSDSGINANLRVLSAIFFILMLLSNFAFSFWGVSMPYYVVCSGMILLLGVTLYIKLANVKL